LLSGVIAVLLLGWAAVMTLDARRAAEEQALARRCTVALASAGIAPGTARAQDLDRVCDPMIADAIAASRTHDSMRDHCEAQFWDPASRAEPRALALCAAVFPVAAWSGASDLRPWRVGAAMLGLLFLLAPLTLWRPRCLTS
jgi:hypothetical protein